MKYFGYFLTFINHTVHWMSYYCTTMVVVQAKFKTSMSGCKQNLIGQINAIKKMVDMAGKFKGVGGISQIVHSMI